MRRGGYRAAVQNRLVRTTAAIAVAALVAVGCGSDGAGEDPPASTSSPATTTSAPAAASSTSAPTTTDAPPESDVPTTDAEISIAGEAEMVFDWTTDRCEDAHIPDIAARAIRNADGLAQLYVSHYVTYRMTGPSLDEVASDCAVRTMQSAFDADPSQHDEAGWIAAPFTEDGETVHAVVHNEYRGFVFEAADRCPLGDHLSCIDVSLTMSVSTDGGATFDHIAAPPDHLAASLPYTYDPEGVPSGLWQTSNIVERDGHFHLMTNISAYPEAAGDPPRQWSCLLRTDDLADPDSWRYWDGSEFAGEFVDPYIDSIADAEVCPPVARPQIGAELVETIVYDESLETYVAMGMTNDPSIGGSWGVYYSTSDDLITWSGRKLLIELPMGPSVEDENNDLRYAYPSIIDPDSESLNFDTSDGEAYVYITRMNAGGNSLDRDLLRYPIESSIVDLEPPDWNFDTDGDAAGWRPTNQLDPFTIADGVLTTVSSGDDPYMESGPTRFPGPVHPTLAVRMSIDAGPATTLGQVFFVTEADPAWGEAKSITFPITSDGEMHDYEIDVSSVPGWHATITGLRLDPGALSGATIEIDAITFA